MNQASQIDQGIHDLKTQLEEQSRGIKAENLNDVTEEDIDLIMENFKEFKKQIDEKQREHKEVFDSNSKIMDSNHTEDAPFEEPNEGNSKVRLCVNLVYS